MKFFCNAVLRPATTHRPVAAAWLARGSFIPPPPQRDLRDLTRQRTNLIQQRAMVVNHFQNVLEWANLKLSAVASNVLGVSARAMLSALVEGETDPVLLAELAKGKLRLKRAALEQALAGFVREHHRFLLAQDLTHLGFLDEQIEAYTQQIALSIQAQAESSSGPQQSVAKTNGSEVSQRSAEERSPERPADWEAAVELLDTIPGVGRETAELIVAEVGTNMRRFGSAAHLASWAKVCPGNNESAGNRHSSRTGRGNRWLRSGLVQAAHAAVKVKDSQFARVYRRLVGRRGVKKAIMAVAHRLLTAVYFMLLNHEPYRELKRTEAEERRRHQQVERMQRQIEHLGYKVNIVPLAAQAA